MLKRTGYEQDVNRQKTISSITKAGCPIKIAGDIIQDMPTNSTESVADYITTELIRRGETEAARRYRSYRAGFSQAALRVLKARYLLPKSDGKSETPRDLFDRVAICMAMPVLGGSAPPKQSGISPFHIMSYEQHSMREYGRLPSGVSGHDKFNETVREYHNIMMDRRFMPNSPTLMNAGCPLGQLSACFVLDMNDDLNDIMETVKETALIFKSGGGVGINYSRLRPSGSPVASTAGTASGPISFMEMVDNVGNTVKQGGRRRAANMGILDASHPDILDFIKAKTGDRLTNFNISVGTDESFWRAISGNHGINANHILDAISESAHRSAEPGVIFFDNVNRYNVLQKARNGPLRSTNPCWGGETRVLTKKGPIPFRDLANGPSKVQVMSREDDGSLSYRVMQNPGITAQNVDVICLVVSSKQTGECTALRCTSTHKVYVVEGTILVKKTVEDLTPGMSLASLYLDGSMYEQTVGVSIGVDEVPQINLSGTGHPTPGILPLSLVRKKDKRKSKKVSTDGFIGPDGTIPEMSPGKEGFMKRVFGRKKNHTVLSVVKIGKTDVYNGMVDGTHNYFVECGDGHYILSGNCGEQALYPNESCNLGSINLAQYVSDDEPDWEGIARDARICTRMLDGVVDMTRHPTPDIQRASNETRRIGLGVMGVADMLMYLGIQYNTPEAYHLFGRMAELISWHSMDESVKMAKERGPFPLYHGTSYSDGMLPFIGDSEAYHTWEHHGVMPWDELIQSIKEYGIRNVLTTTIAPTGTISMIAGCSSGIEPVYSLVYTKTVSVGSFHYGCPALSAIHPDVVPLVARNGGVMPPGIIPDENVFITARQIHWADHIIAQAAWQRWIGNSISKTINMSRMVTIQDIRDAYVLAHALGCRGLTVYRDGSRDTQVLESGNIEAEPEPSEVARCLV